MLHQTLYDDVDLRPILAMTRGAALEALRSGVCGTTCSDSISDDALLRAEVGGARRIAAEVDHSNQWPWSFLLLAYHIDALFGPDRHDLKIPPVDLAAK